MASINLSLDEIIAKTKAAKKGRGQDSTFKSDSVQGRRAERGGARRAGNGGGSRTGGSFTKSVPGGKWRHDKFAESESRGGGVSSSPRGGVLATAVNANKKVRVNVSNLAPTVSTADLEELFAPYSIDSAACHYGETGEHLGTGDVVMKKKDAQKALTDFQGVSVDGNRLVLAIVDGGVGAGSIFDRVQIAKVGGGGGIQKRSRDSPIRGRRDGGRDSGRRGGNNNRSTGGGAGRHPLDRTDDGEAAPRGGRGGAGGKGGRGGKKGPITEEELDAELNAYMKKPAMEH